MASNLLGGRIPSTLGSLSGLILLDLYNNMLTGQTPSSLGQLQMLQALSLSYNNPTGGLPQSLSNLTSMEVFWILSNLIFGEISPDLFTNWTKLVPFHVQDNLFTGKIPAGVGQAKELDTFYCCGNNLSGSIPPEIGNLSKLSRGSWQKQPQWSNSSISRKIFKYRNHTPLLQQNFWKNSCSFWKFQLVAYTWLGQQFVFRLVPPTISSLNQLIFLDLSVNNLIGQIPELAIPQSNTSSTVPSSTCSLLYMRRLDLLKNHLSGNVTQCLWNMTDLMFLNLANNQFFWRDSKLNQFHEFSSVVSLEQ